MCQSKSGKLKILYEKYSVLPSMWWGLNLCKQGTLKPAFQNAGWLSGKVA